MPSLHYLLSASPEQVAANHIGETIQNVSRTLPEVVGFTRMPNGLWEGPPAIREASPDGSRIYDPNTIYGNFAQFEKYDYATGFYLAANLPQTDAAAANLGWAIIQYGGLEDAMTVDLLDIEATQPYDRKVAVATGMQSLVRSVLEWYDVRL